MAELRAGKMRRILCHDRLPERAHLARSGFPTCVPQEKAIFSTL